MMIFLFALEEEWIIDRFRETQLRSDHISGRMRELARLVVCFNTGTKF